MNTLIEPTDRQLTRVQLRDPEVYNSLVGRLRMVVAAAERALARPIGGSTAGVMAEVTERAAELCTGLVNSNPDFARRAAETVMAALVSPAEARTVDFWETALGRVCAMRGGYPNPTMPRSVAGALLDVGRERVRQMVALGLLGETAQQQIETATLVRLLVPA